MTACGDVAVVCVDPACVSLTSFEDKLSWSIYVVASYWSGDIVGVVCMSVETCFDDEASVV